VNGNGNGNGRATPTTGEFMADDATDDATTEPDADGTRGATGEATDTADPADESGPAADGERTGPGTGSGPDATHDPGSDRGRDPDHDGDRVEGADAAPTADRADERATLVERLRERGVIERESTAAAIGAVPRHEFVPEERRANAYVDRPLPIGAGQTISAPHMVAVMTDLLALSPGDRVLEVGTGCGYHAAVTAELVDGTVYSVEYDPELAAAARDRLARLGYDVAVRTGDGREGWPEHAPYDAAYLTCAPRSVPDAVIEQVRPEGVTVAPVGDRRQELVRLRRRADGGVDREPHGGVRFVPMRGRGD
jgi:protein-L-isoaspartate(D-aspartate) O-methyltransferase